MAYEAPDSSVLRSTFPAFANVSEMAIDLALSEAAIRTDATWPDADRRLGSLLYAAHVLTLDGQGSSNEAQFGAFKRLKIGSLELEKAASGTDEALRGSLGSTSYGVRFLAIVRRLFPPVLVV